MLTSQIWVVIRERPIDQALDLGGAAEEDAMLVSVEGPQPRKGAAVIRPTPFPGGIDPTQRRGHRRPRRHRVAGQIGVLAPLQQRILHTPLSQQRQQPAALRPGDADLGRAPRRGEVGGGDQTDDRVGPAQPLVQPLLPRFTHGNARVWVVIQEHLVAIMGQPSMHLVSQLTVLAGVAEEYPGHRPSRPAATNRSNGIMHPQRPTVRPPGSGHWGHVPGRPRLFG
jgi:hypothetical protein